MSSSAGQARGGGRGILFALGAGLGAVGVVLLLRRQQRTELATAGVMLPIPAELPVVEAEPLVVEVNPAPIVRGRPVTVLARALPGATCRIDARYTTGFAPRSMDGQPQTIDADGACRWQWVVRTRGDGLRIVIKVTLPDGTTAQRTRRVAVVDEDD